MFLPAEMITVVSQFAPAFRRATYRKAVELMIGVILAPGKRTVTSALRMVGKAQAGDWSKYHQVLNRAKWSGLEVSQILLRLLVTSFVAGQGVITIAVDETLERRWGRQIRKRGHWRDSLASSRKMNVTTSGLRWLVLAVVVNLPWTPYAIALPFLSLLLTTPKVSEKLGKRHRTVAQVTGICVAWLRRSLPGRAIQLVGDGAYAVIALGLLCQRYQVTLVAPLRLDARLFEAPLRLRKKSPGRPAVVGARLPNLAAIALSPATRWQRSQVDWYGGTTQVVDWVSGCALWYSTGTDPLPIRWLLVRDPQSKRPIRAFFSTHTAQIPPIIIDTFVKRWPLEVTFEASRAYLGVETQRQSSDKAIERTTPALFGIFSLVVLMAHSLYPDEPLPLPQSAWYPKTHATFHDLLTLVRKRLWLHSLFQTGAFSPDLRLFSLAQIEPLLSAVSY
jgi:DDE superfamily endonuclease